MKKLIKGAVIAVAIAAIVISVGMGYVYHRTNQAIAEKVEYVADDVAFASDITAVTLGQHLYESRGCADCHGADGGGKLVFEAPPMGRFAGSNLTALQEYTDAQWATAIRFAIAPDGRKLLMMPSHHFAHYSNLDIGAMVAYIRQLPVVDRESIPNEVGPLARILYLRGEFALLPYEMIDTATQKFQNPTTGPTVEYGEYLLPGCTGCHGPTLSGGTIPGTPPDWPPAANLTADTTGLHNWSFKDFKHFVATGKRPNGDEINAVMPLSMLQAMHEWELEAIWTALRARTPVAFGNR